MSCTKIKHLPNKSAEYYTWQHGYRDTAKINCKCRFIFQDYLEQPVKRAVSLVEMENVYILPINMCLHDCEGQQKQGSVTVWGKVDGTGQEKVGNYITEMN